MKLAPHIRKTAGVIRIIFFASLLVTAFPVAAQEVVSLKTAGRPLKDVLTDISQQGGYTIEYQSAILSTNPKARDLSLSNTDVATAIKHVLSDQPIDFLIQDKSIMLFKKQHGAAEDRSYLFGQVKNAEGKALPFTNVAIPSLSLRTVTDNQGVFRFPPLPHGSYELVFSFIGYKTQRITAVLADHQPTGQIEVTLAPHTTALEGITVSGMRQGEASSLSAMREAPNIQYVLSQQQIERFPDLTVGEALQRVPGLTMSYEYGIPQMVIMRGLEAEDGAVTINGNRVPSTEPRFRTVDLVSILANTVERIEVVKTLTPNMDADGTAGAINIVSKSPPANSSFVDARLSGGYNLLSGKGNFETSITMGGRKNRWGYVFGANYSQSGRAEDRIKKSYGSKLGDEELNSLLKGIELEATDLNRKHIGVQGELNYYTAKNEIFYLRASYNGFIDEQHQHNLNYAIKGYTSQTDAGDVVLETNGWYRDKRKNTLMASTGGAKQIGQLQLDYDISYARGFYKSERDYRVVFEQKKLSGQLDLTDPEAPQVSFAQGDVMNADLFTNKFLRDRSERALDGDLIASLNIKYPFRLLAGDQGMLQAGGRHRNKYNSRDRGEDEYTYDGTLTLQDYISPFSRNAFYNNSYGLTLFPDARGLYGYQQTHPTEFVFDQTGSIRNSKPDTYTGRELLSAAYLMASWQWSRLQVVTGVRYEGTDMRYNGTLLKLGPKDVYVGEEDIQASKKFDSFLPSINIRYGLTERTNLRGAVTRSLSRPGYFDLVPWEEARGQNNNIKRGNPDLVQSQTTNYDLLSEHYFRSIGLLSAGVFYKDVKNKVYKEKIDHTEGEWAGWTVETPRNGKSAEVYGIEAAWQQQLTFLPGLFNGLGIYVNYTRIWSTMRTPNVADGRAVRLPDARPHSGNFALSYEKYGFSGRVAANWYSTFVSSIGDIAADDKMERGRVQLDVSAAQRITRRTSFFIGLNNLTDAPISTGYRDGRPDNDRNYGIWGNAGIKITLM